MRKLRVLLADDHETVREGLKLLVNAQPDMEVVAEAADGVQTVNQARRISPDVVVMDISMPELNGLKATEAVKQSCPGVHVLTLTRHADDGYLQRLLRAGASGYVLKQSRAAELIHAIRAVASGGKYLDPALAGRVIREYGRRPSDGAAQGERHDLTAREEEVLRLIAWGYSNKEVAERLSLSVKTVETHKSNAMHKLGLANRMDIVTFALRYGWLRES